MLIKVANHTECRCMEPAIIRRNAQPHRSIGWVYNLALRFYFFMNWDFYYFIYFNILIDSVIGSCSPMGQLSKDSRRLCASGFIWDCSSDRCIPYPSSTPGVCVCACNTGQVWKLFMIQAAHDNLRILLSCNWKGGGREPNCEQTFILVIINVVNLVLNRTLCFMLISKS